MFSRYDMTGNKYDRPTPRIGELYRHFKGHVYKVLLISRCTETQQMLISYENTEKNGEVWTRPLTMFMGVLGEDPNWCYRFEKIESKVAIDLLTNS